MYDFKNVKGIITKRKITSWPSWLLFFEWEDIFSIEMNVPLVEYKSSFLSKLFGKKKVYDYVCKIIDFIFKDRIGIYKNNDLYFAIQMNIFNPLPVMPWRRGNLVPYIVDAFLKESDLEYIYWKYKKCPLVIISSLEVYNYLKSQNCPLNIAFVPFSIADRYRIDSYKLTKRYEILAAGRGNPVLEAFMKRYLEEKPETEFVYRKAIQDGNFIYYSTKKGFLGNIDTRDDYIDLLKNSKVAFYSNVGINEVRNTNGFHPVSMRYLEFVASQCHIVAQYPDSEESKYFELHKISPNITSYEDFKRHIDFCLSEDIDLNKYRLLIEKHYTSSRVATLSELFSKL